ncbi:MAG TPA: hypothetical protein VFS75_02150, partial [Candidatus Paceibacterota bacterium]|nr:hypothetical protein [Candidatus Paceibacterota bacterium]
RDYANDTAGRILGAARYDVKAGLVPTMVELVRPTIAGNTYQVSFYTDEGATTFKSGEDKPIEGGEATFTAK